MYVKTNCVCDVKKNYSNEKNINCELILKRWEENSVEKNTKELKIFRVSFCLFI